MLREFSANFVMSIIRKRRKRQKKKTKTKKKKKKKKKSFVDGLHSVRTYEDQVISAVSNVQNFIKYKPFNKRRQDF